MPTAADLYAEMEHLAKRYGKVGMQAIAGPQGLLAERGRGLTPT
jgi:hypothetical protein